MWEIKKVPVRIERDGLRVRLARYEYKWIVSSYGAFFGVAATERGVRRAMVRGQSEMLAGDDRRYAR